MSSSSLQSLYPPPGPHDLTDAGCHLYCSLQICGGAQTWSGLWGGNCRETKNNNTNMCERGGGKRKKRKQYHPTPTLASLLFQSPFLGDPHLLHSQPSRVLTRFVTHTIHPVSQSGHAHFLPPGKSPVQPRRRWVSSSRQATCATISNVSAFKGSIATSTLYHHTGLFHGHLLRRLGERQTARVG